MYQIECACAHQTGTLWQVRTKEYKAKSMSNEAASICEVFFRIYFENHDVRTAALYLAEDVRWFGDSASDLARGKTEVIALLHRGVNLLDPWSQRLLNLNLHESETIPGDFQFVDGFLTVYDEKSAGETKLLISAVMRRENEAFVIQQMHFHSFGSAEQGAMDRNCDAVLSNVPGGIAVLAHAGTDVKLLYFNDQLCRIFGMTRAEFEKESFLEQFLDDPDYEETSLSAREEGDPESRVITIEREAVRHDGTSVRLRIVRWVRDRGEATLIHAIILDITGEAPQHNPGTDRTPEWHADCGSLLNRETNAILFDCDPDGKALTYCIFRPDGTIWDETVPLEELIIERPLIHPDDKFDCKKALDGAMRAPKQSSLEARMRIVSDEYVWYRVEYASIADNAGKVIRIVGRLENIQWDKEIETITRAEMRRETLYRRASMSGAELSLVFDMVTAEWIESDVDILPAWLPEDIRLWELLSGMRDAKVHPAERSLLSEAQLREIRDRLSQDRSGTVELEFRFRPDSDSEYRWMRLKLTTVLDEDMRFQYTYLSMTNIHESKLAAERRWEETNLDALTRLPTREAFHRSMAERLRADSDADCSMILIRIDNTEKLLEALGIEEVDKQIRLAGQTVRACAHEGELVCRYSADEFAIFCPKAPEEDIMSERLRMICVALRRPDGVVSLSASVGCAFRAEGALRTEALFIQAICALRWAYRQGGNRYVIYTPDIGRHPDEDDISPITKLQGSRKRIFVRTFGYFDVFIDGKAIPFNSAKSKELLALLIDRKGGFVTANEALSLLWEDEPTNTTTLARYRKVAMRLKNTLEEYGVPDIVETINGNRRIAANLIDCDYYDYLSGNKMGAAIYTGSYLSNYSWAEETIAILNEKREQDDEELAGL